MPGALLAAVFALRRIRPWAAALQTGDMGRDCSSPHDRGQRVGEVRGDLARADRAAA